VRRDLQQTRMGELCLLAQHIRAGTQEVAERRVHDFERARLRRGIRAFAPQYTVARPCLAFVGILSALRLGGELRVFGERQNGSVADQRVRREFSDMMSAPSWTPPKRWFA
jgi:hypothetical protein